MAPPGAIPRREAVRRVALLLGTAVSTPTVAGLLAGCSERAQAPGWAPRVLSADRAELVATIAEHIIPATDTPGARAVGVHRFVDVLLADFYPAPERQRFLDGLADVDARARAAHGQAFVTCTPAQQVALLTALDREAYAKKSPGRRAPSAAAVVQEDPQRNYGGRTAAPEAVIASGAADVDGAFDPRGPRTPAGVDTADAARRRDDSAWCFRRMKELTLAGYYTSQVGSTAELRVNPMGRYVGDLPYAQAGRTWA